MSSRPTIWRSHVMAPLNVFIASVGILATSESIIDNSTPCLKDFANHFSMHESSITISYEARTSNFCPWSQSVTSCPRQAHFNKQSTLLNEPQREYIIRDCMMIIKLCWIRYTFSASKAALLSPAALYQVRQNQFPKKLKIWTLDLGPDCPHIPPNVSGTEIHAIESAPRYLQLLFRAFGVLFIVGSQFNNMILRQPSNASNWLNSIAERFSFLNSNHLVYYSSFEAFFAEIPVFFSSTCAGKRCGNTWL